LIALDPHERTIPVLVERAASIHGERPCLSAGDVSLSFEDVHDAARRFAGTLAAAGVQPGDRVAIVSENRWEVLALLLGCAWRGSILVPINVASRGSQLEHMLSNAGPRIVALERGLQDRLETVALPPELERIWAIGWDGVEGSSGPPVEPFPLVGDPLGPAPVSPGTTLAILYTSGTTGPSKGVMCPHAQFTWWGEIVGGMLGVSEDDVLYTGLPLFHTNALNAFTQALVHGARCVVGPRFSSSQFWRRLIDADATVTYLVGAMASILASTEPTALDRAHRVRVALAPATPADVCEVFAERFGVSLVDAHGMTETNAAIGPSGGGQRPGWMGRVMPGFAASVVDEQDVEVPDGTPGELVLRSDRPFAFATGYWRMPEATVEAWRNLWFHAGDRVVRDGDGYFRFLDRLKDAIRRRGENVSAWEVEQVLLRHPAIEAAAVFPVPSELGEDEVMACVVPRKGEHVDPVSLVRFCEPLIAYFAIPRYIDLVDELPLTENGKVRKFVLRERGVTPTAWDRESAGIELRR
jgi:crotonobetaine/carnitine-CoA ligase